MEMSDLHKDKPLKYLGLPVLSAKRAIIMVHGRGADADDILGLSKEIWFSDLAYVAPEASGNTWYPYSFIAPVEVNEPSLSSALELIGFAVDEVVKANKSFEQIFLLGFSQGACLVLEYAARNAKRYAGIFALSGGLIGQSINESNYKGSFEGTPVFFGCSNFDPHIPEERVNQSAEIYSKMGATVTKKIYPNMPHTIIQDEIDHINKIIMSV